MISIRTRCLCRFLLRASSTLLLVLLLLDLLAAPNSPRQHTPSRSPRIYLQFVCLVPHVHIPELTYHYPLLGRRAPAQTWRGRNNERQESGKQGSSEYSLKREQLRWTVVSRSPDLAIRGPNVSSARAGLCGLTTSPATPALLPPSSWSMTWNAEKRSTEVHPSMQRACILQISMPKRIKMILMGTARTSWRASDLEFFTIHCPDHRPHPITSELLHATMMRAAERHPSLSGVASPANRHYSQSLIETT